MHYDIELNSAAHYPVRGIVDLSPSIEQAGFGAFWKGESNSADPIVCLSAIATGTRAIKLGTAVYHVFGRSPVTLGIQAATLNDLSDGRVLLTNGSQTSIYNPMTGLWNPTAGHRNTIGGLPTLLPGEMFPEIEMLFVLAGAIVPPPPSVAPLATV